MSIYPTLFVDPEIVRSNIQRMAEKARKRQVEFRPHFKTHQSKAIGANFRDFGVKGITVSSIKMAEYFATDGWDDITIAFPCNVLAGFDYDDLASRIKLKTLVSSTDVIKKLDGEISNEIGLYIEIDPDYHRSGISVNDTDRIATILDAIEISKHFYPAGFYCHAGQTYKARSKKQIEKIAREVLQKLELLKAGFPSLPICFGDTPSCSVLNTFETVDQISPGNFVFYDWMQVEIGSCSPNEIAVYMECPVIEKYPDRNQVLIHGGAIHFSKESIIINNVESFGEPRLKHLSEQTYLSSLSQEHGIIQCSKPVFDEIDVGDMIQIFPIHSCLTANLMAEYHTTDGQVLDHMNSSPNQV